MSILHLLLSKGLELLKYLLILFTPGGILHLHISKGLGLLKYLLTHKILAAIEHIVSYKSAGDYEYLAISGFGIDKTKVRKQDLVFGFQSCVKFEVSGVKYNSIVDVLSADNFAHAVETVFIIGPDVSHDPKLVKYATLFSSNPSIVRKLVGSLIEQATRESASALAINQDMLGWINRMKSDVFGAVESKVESLGLFIYVSDIRLLNIRREREVEEELDTAKIRCEIEKARREIEKVKALQTLALEREKIQVRLKADTKIATELRKIDLEFYRRIRQADARVYQTRAQVEALKILAEALAEAFQARQRLRSQNSSGERLTMVALHGK